MKNNHCIIVQSKNQEERLLPWFLYHKNQGFSKFLYFDDFSEDNSVKTALEIRDLYDIDIEVHETDGKGTMHSYENSRDSNSYGTSSLCDRIIRSYNSGLEILRNQMDDAYVAFIDTDEYLVTSIPDKTVVDVINDFNNEHLYIHSFDVKDGFSNGDFPYNDESSYRWDFEDRKKNKVYWQRGKSIGGLNLVDKMKELPNVVHTITSPPERGPTGTYYDALNIENYDVLRIHHFRKPNQDPNIKITFDNTLTKKCLKSKCERVFFQGKYLIQDAI